MNMPGLWIDSVRRRKSIREIILDMDSSVSKTHGDQEGSAFNGHFGCSCYHPLFCFNQYGDLERALLREGNVHSAADWRFVLEPVVADTEMKRYGDTSVAMPPLPHRAFTTFSKKRIICLPSVFRQTRGCRIRSGTC